MDFLLVAELGRVLLFSWEELELFSSSSSSSSKLMLLEMPTVSRGHIGMSTHAFYSGNTGDPVWIHIQPLTLLHPDTHRDAHQHIPSQSCKGSHLSRHIQGHGFSLVHT